MAVLVGVVAMIVWEIIVALVAKRRPVPLIFYALGVIVASAIAAFVLTSRIVGTSTLLLGSVGIGFLAAVGVIIIWELTHGEESREKGGGVGVRVVRDLVIRGAAFSILIFVISIAVRALHLSGSP
jgi:hypothetical protein